jgi:CMP-N-acetylneuraminic acid synthetase
MFRKDVLLQLGGYIEEFTAQDGYEIWIRYIRKYSPYNVNIPLFYYRQHSANLTKNVKRILETRRNIKRKFVERELNGSIPKVLGLIPVVGSSIYTQASPFEKLGKKPLLWYTLNEAQKANSLDRIILSSEDDRVLNYGRKFVNIEPIKREKKWAKVSFRIQDFITYILDKLKRTDGYEPDAVCTLYITTPLRRYYHVDKAVDTMAIFGVDSVISVQEELANCYHHEGYGLSSINNSRNGIRVERDAIYKENSAIFISRTEIIREGRLLGDKIGHITMLPEESVKTNTKYDLWLSEHILKDWQKNK